MRDKCHCVTLLLVTEAHLHDPQTLSHHLKKLREAELVGVERRGLWAYYYVRPEALEVLKRWLS